jgi:hypothetical protein
MKKKILARLVLSILLLSLFVLKGPVFAADPHLELAPSSGTITDSGTEIDINIDTGGSEAKSVKAVINFDSSKLEVSSVEAGTFFDEVSHNIYSNQVIINANLSLEASVESKTGVGTIATMVTKAKVDNGIADITFDCTEGDSTDSGISDPTPTDIIVCSANVNGSYDLGGSSGGTSSSPIPSDESSSNSSSSAPDPSELPESGTREFTIGFISLGAVFVLLGLPGLVLNYKD